MVLYLGEYSKSKFKNRLACTGFKRGGSKVPGFPLIINSMQCMDLHASVLNLRSRLVWIDYTK